MSKQRAIFFISLFLTMTMGAFQNCSKDMSFGSNDDGLIVAYDVQPDLGDGKGGVDDDDDVVTVIIDDSCMAPGSCDDDKGSDDASSNVGVVIDASGNTGVVSDSDNNSDNNSDSDNNEEPDLIVEDTCFLPNGKECKGKDIDLDRNNNANAQEYICILDGPGKSVRAGYTNAGIEAIGRTPLTICTSYEGCLAIGDARGDLKSIESPRGFCKNNSAGSVQMSLNEVLAHYSGL